MSPIKEKSINNAAGPPFANALPLPTKRPVPMEPPIAIICKCLPFNLLFKCASSYVGGFIPSPGPLGTPFSTSSPSAVCTVIDPAVPGMAGLNESNARWKRLPREAWVGVVCFSRTTPSSTYPPAIGSGCFLYSDIAAERCTLTLDPCCVYCRAPGVWNQEVKMGSGRDRGGNVHHINACAGSVRCSSHTHEMRFPTDPNRPDIHPYVTPVYNPTENVSNVDGVSLGVRS
ncbi:hypothetical protein G7K_0629-t1 [Saitoella complicata NRRL Y-17804]|uniref:Uncharacterized protein n=1 Tax=Saitoella complicata (strain BCRC 22490 / CBS 7301 / JCM 7358 / NBRC 10748 / NRRL Y-17804) TaxID=698492 RepID=A0A0E9N9D8_SAICN|nr:hypothetical protein G7K_0629-t1 [Saitoella complicata NRRL Y-17804]